jgi:16S rRNA (guanine966-N2)-methyltransferase
MKIIAGRWRGRHLMVPPTTLRPTSDRNRETIFNLLMQAIPEAAVLDLFAGSGALGMEALSRGAASCTWVDQHREAARLIRENIEKLDGAETPLASRVRCQEVAQWLRSPAPAGPYDIVLADPPYQEDRAWLTRLLAELPACGALAKRALLVFEGHKHLDPVEQPHWTLLRDRTYGLTRLHIYRYIHPDVAAVDHTEPPEAPHDNATGDLSGNI